MFKFTRALIQTAKCNHLNGYARLCFSSAPTAELKTVNQDAENIKTVSKRGGIVAAAFASLKTIEVGEVVNTPHTDRRITSATTVDELLSISNGTGVSRKHALKVVSVLAEWSSSGKVALPDFETDPRFLKLCRVLSKTTPKTNNRTAQTRSEDVSTILSITADDEAAKLVSSITLPQMVKVMTTLSYKKRRSIVLLRSLAFNITKRAEIIDLKQCGDLLYGMAVLNFPDENLLEKVCYDVCKGISDDLNKSAVIGSILTSLGLLKYKDIGVMETLCKWMVKHANGSRPQDIFALFLTMAVLRYEPSNSQELHSVLVPLLKQVDAIKSTVWLDFVWSLTLLDKTRSEHLESVLNKKFIEQLKGENALSVVNKLKLLNIDLAAQYFTLDYKGPRLSEHLDVKDIEIPRNKEKEDMCSSIVDCLKNLMPEKCFKVKVNTGMGFYIDVECGLDQKCTPVPIDDNATPNQQRVAILVYQYQDMCKGTNEPTGLSHFTQRLLEKRGYKVITIPYTEYRPKDKLVDRVKYLQRKLKSIV